MMLFRPVRDQGEYRLQSEDGSAAATESTSTRVSEAFSHVPADPLADLLSLGRAAVQSLQADVIEADEVIQLVTPLVLGEPCLLRAAPQPSGHHLRMVVPAKAVQLHSSSAGAMLVLQLQVMQAHCQATTPGDTCDLLWCQAAIS